MPERCPWPKSDLSIAYHDTEWGVPQHADQMLFEHLLLGGAQAGLSWETVLRKRQAYRLAFDGFDAQKIAAYTDPQIQTLLQNPGIIRNRQKIRSAIQNAQAVLSVQEQFGSLNAYIWQFVEGRPITNHWQELSQIPVTSPASDAMSRDLKKRGFSFVGSTICYAYMQAVGMINDHVTTCFRHREISNG